MQPVLIESASLVFLTLVKRTGLGRPGQPVLKLAMLFGNGYGLVDL